jgi:hypothetical protein
LAAVTIGSINPYVVNAQRLAGRKMRQFIVVTDGGTADTWTFPGDDPVVEVAWAGATAGDYVAPFASGSIITFSTDAGAKTGRLTVWT